MKLTRSLLGLAALSLLGAAHAQPVIDGSYDAIYGAPMAVQNTQTNFGDATWGLVDYCDGSELDQVFAYRDSTHLYLFIAGNLESNFNKLEIFIDSRPGGQNRLDGVQPDTDFGALPRMAGTGIGDGLTFDAGFEADFWFSMTGGGLALYALYANFGEIGTLNGQWLGEGVALNGTLINSNNLGVEATLNNSNTLGVTAGTGPDNGAGVNTGMEWKIPLSLIAASGGPIKVCIFINGQGHDFVSNQVLPGIGGGDNLGEPRLVNFANIPGDQFFTIPGTGPTISGTLELQDLDPSAPLPAQVTFEIRNATNTTLLDTQTVSLGTGGEFMLFAPGNDQYVISVKTGTWLRKNRSVNTTSGSVTGADLSLMNGDIDGDNEVTVGDFAILSVNFGGEGPDGDLNQDGSVDIGDYAILSGNFGALGDD